jgi:hypothetical protein
MATALLAATGTSCTTINPGPNYEVPQQQFDANYFYCVVEPQIIMGGLTGTPCGDNGSHGCHYSDKVPEMSLQALPAPVTCAGSGTTAVPTNPSQTAAGTPAANNFSSVGEQMNAQYTTAPIYIWPTQLAGVHPIQVYKPSDTAVTNILSTWANATN